ncbi:MAG: molybdopterin adenylyltransferase [Dehalococcoidales bacterium]|jgi:molybdenum cofactor synthesis domain-containing protein
MIQVGILTISDKGSRGQRQDKSGEVMRDGVARMQGTVAKYEIVPDEAEVIADKLAEWADSGKMDLILTTGGTGLSQRDVTPEATLSVIDRSIPGIAEAMRAKSLEKTPTAMLSRAVAGQRGNCLIVNMPGSPKAVQECLEAILPALPHAVEIIKGEVTEHSLTDAVKK